VGIGTASPSYKTEISDGTVTFGVNPLSAYSTAYVGTTTNHGMNFITNSNSRLNITSGGNVGIGTTPSVPLHVYHATTNGVARFESGDATALVQFKDSGTTLVPPSIGAVSNALVMQTNNIEAARIDSSQNLLVGGTSLGQNGAVTMSGDGRIYATRVSDTAGFFGRTSTDGSIVNFTKDGTTVGSIGSYQGDMWIGTGDTTLFFHDGIDAILPSGTSGAGSDGQKTLGYSNSRFKDLYLSGGVYLGGTGSANHLDDYEEGTWTPSLSGATYSSGTRYGYYTKIGDTVIANCVFDNASVTSGSVVNVTGLPFTVSTGTGATRFPGFNAHTAGSAVIETIQGGYALQGSVNFRLIRENSFNTVSLGTGSFYMFLTIIYKA
jgi:hypothetical protein